MYEAGVTKYTRRGILWMFDSSVNLAFEDAYYYFLVEYVLR